MLLRVACCCVLAWRVAGAPPAAFDRLKALEGEWEGTDSAGLARRAAFRVIAGGSAVEETLFHPQEPSMVSIYHPDGAKIGMTHYCSAHNQPRLEALPAAPGVLDFRLVSVSNLAKPGAGHIGHLKLTFLDESRLRQEWTWREKGNDHVLRIELRRK